MLLLSVNYSCAVLFCVLSIHLPLVLLFPSWQFCYWNEIPIKYVMTICLVIQQCTCLIIYNIFNH